MKKASFFAKRPRLLLIICLIILVCAAALNLIPRKNKSICREGDWVLIPCEEEQDKGEQAKVGPIEEDLVEEIQTETEQPIRLGGDSDEHGCIGSAGYSWCEAKQKCLRIWEEICDLEKSSSEITGNSEVIISKPTAGGLVSSPLTVEGQARGTWFFEANLPVKLVDIDGNVIAVVGAQAQSDWMTEQMVPFKADLTFIAPAITNGYLIISKDNPSGLPENDVTVRMPVRFK